jgi:hypothetical protein
MPNSWRQKVCPGSTLSRQHPVAQHWPGSSLHIALHWHTPWRLHTSEQHARFSEQASPSSLPHDSRPGQHDVPSAHATQIPPCAPHASDVVPVRQRPSFSGPFSQHPFGQLSSEQQLAVAHLHIPCSLHAVLSEQRTHRCPPMPHVSFEGTKQSPGLPGPFSQQPVGQVSAVHWQRWSTHAPLEPSQTSHATPLVPHAVLDLPCWH